MQGYSGVPRALINQASFFCPESRKTVMMSAEIKSVIMNAIELRRNVACEDQEQCSWMLRRMA